MKTIYYFAAALLTSFLLVGCGKNDPKIISKNSVTNPQKNISYEQYDSTDPFFIEINNIIKSKAVGDATVQLSVTSKPLSGNFYEISANGEEEGGAHPITYSNSTYYFRNPFKQVMGIDIFKVEKLTELSSFIFSEHKKSLDKDELQCVEDVKVSEISDSIKKGSFTITDKTFTIDDIGVPYACRSVGTAAVNWNLLKPYINEGFSKELSSFYKSK